MDNNKKKKVRTCTICGTAHPLHEFEEGRWGCDNCKRTFGDRLPPKTARDEFGNPLFPESVE